MAPAEFPGCSKEHGLSRSHLGSLPISSVRVQNGEWEIVSGSDLTSSLASFRALLHLCVSVYFHTGLGEGKGTESKRDRRIAVCSGLSDHTLAILTALSVVMPRSWRSSVVLL